MATLALAGFAFLALHAIPATPLRSRLVAATGESVYLGVYSLLALILLVLWTRAFAAAPVDAPLWYFASWWPWVKAAILLLAAFLLVAGVSTRDPLASAPGKPAPERPGTPKGVFTITRHPFLWSAGIWAVLHLISQPNLRGLIFYGMFALLAFGGAKVIDMRKAAQFGEAWKPFVAQTSYLPFLALAQGRAKLDCADVGWIRFMAALVVWAGFLLLHSWLFTASPLPELL